VKAEGNYGTSGIPGGAAGDLIIDAYIDSEISPDQVIIAYTNGWVYGKEIGVDEHNNPLVTPDGGLN